MPNDLGNFARPKDPGSWRSSSTWGDLRPGSITAVTRHCGKPSCHCAKHTTLDMIRNFVLLGAWRARP